MKRNEIKSWLSHRVQSDAHPAWSYWMGGILFMTFSLMLVGVCGVAAEDPAPVIVETIIDSEAPAGFVLPPADFDIETSTIDRQYQPFSICDEGDLVECAKYAQQQCRELYDQDATTAQHLTLNFGQGWERVCVYQCKYHDTFRIARCKPTVLKPAKPKPVSKDAP